MDRVTMLRFEKLKYFRSLPSCAWQSAHRASIRGLFGRLLATSGACCQSSFPATIEAVSPRGAFHDSGSSSTNRSEEHTSELQSRLHLVCRLLLEKKKNRRNESSVFPNH